MHKIIQWVLKSAPVVRRALSLVAKHPKLSLAIPATVTMALGRFFGSENEKPQALLDRLAGASDQVVAGAIQEVFLTATPADARAFADMLIQAAGDGKDTMAELIEVAALDAADIRRSGDGATSAVRMDHERFVALKGLIDRVCWAFNVNPDDLQQLRRVLAIDADEFKYVVK